MIAYRPCEFRTGGDTARYGERKPYKSRRRENRLPAGERHRLAMSMNGYCWEVAHRRARLPGFAGHLEDIYQAAMAGALIAARRFDPKRGCKFSTFACWYVRAAVTAYRDQQDPAGFKGARHNGRKAPPQTFSLNDPLGDAGELVDICEPDRTPDDPAAGERLAAMLRPLDARSRRVMVMRFVEGMTLTDIGAELGFSKERARQIVMAALHALRQRQEAA